jgi:hypothetical protein
MAEPFTLTLLPDAKPLTLKPGWHKRALAAERRHKATTAPQKGNPDADAKAVTYAVWLATRDGIAIPGDGAVSRVDWQPCAHGVRPRAVEWFPPHQPYRPAARGMAQPAVVPLVRIELPHWDYEAPAVVETTLREWAAPVVTELPAADHAALVAILDPCETGAVAEPCAPAPVETAEAGHVEALAICPAVGMPCKVDCGFRAGCGRPVEAEACPVAAAEAEPLAARCSDDDVPAPRPARNPPAPRALPPPHVGILSRPPVVGIAGGVLPASIMRQVIPGLGRCPAPLLSASI